MSTSVDKTRGFVQEVQAEIKKVSWPTRKELQESTLLVLVTVWLLMILTWGVDTIFSKLLEQIAR